jgi:hypothetical protein
VADGWTELEHARWQALAFVERWNTGDGDAELPVEYLLIVAQASRQTM